MSDVTRNPTLPPIGPEGRKAAFFDLDRTILDMHTMILFARYLQNKRVVSEKNICNAKCGEKRNRPCAQQQHFL
ncbi:hypothetical protein FZ025_05695 [Xanthomonas hyacinthi]|uniref:hypothetical protein n=1 Tax=Xanthomonas hyacinthi TaxID=56455 RepID=UPI0011B0A5EC|nr:hypothetical protein [Xanthomonas hyacinthi]QGY76184.1 hypothetical protein FZ025_05695 [Xanthomonas hyacinthi]